VESLSLTRSKASTLKRSTNHVVATIVTSNFSACFSALGLGLGFGLGLGLT
jgi:small-conductance mechanosensitive channel